MKISILLPAFKRPYLLNLGLASLAHFKPTVDYEIIVLNDGIEDETEAVVDSYKKDLNIKYIFTGQRNLDGVIKSRVPGFALNIGIKQAEGDTIILSCPEMYHLNNTIDLIAYELERRPKSMVIPNFVYFDSDNITTKSLLKQGTFTSNIDVKFFGSGGFETNNAKMPFLFGVMKQELIDIGGYDEDFIGYACEDSDLTERLKEKGLIYRRVGAQVIHLFHEGTNDSKVHWDNPEWVYNYKLFVEKKGIIKRNVGKPWGELR